MDDQGHADEPGMTARLPDDDASLRERGDGLWDLGADLIKRGRAAERKRRPDEAKRLYEEAVQALVDAQAALRRCRGAYRRAVGATIQLGEVLGRLERFDEVLIVLDVVMEEIGIVGTVPYEGSLGDAFGDVIPQVVSVWLTAFERVGRWDEAVPAAESVVAAFDPGTTQARREVVVEAFRLLAAAALARQDQAGALAAWNEMIERCDGEQHREFVLMKAQAMGGTAKLLGEVGRVDEALTLCDEALAQFGSVSYRPTKEVIAAIRRTKYSLSPPPRPRQHGRFRRR
jgi:hypothetical protein